MLSVLHGAIQNKFLNFSLPQLKNRETIFIFKHCIGYEIFMEIKIDYLAC